MKTQRGLFKARAFFGKPNSKRPLKKKNSRDLGSVASIAPYRTLPGSPAVLNTRNSFSFPIPKTVLYACMHARARTVCMYAHTHTHSRARSLSLARSHTPVFKAGAWRRQTIARQVRGGGGCMDGVWMAYVLRRPSAHRGPRAFWLGGGCAGGQLSRGRRA